MNNLKGFDTGDAIDRMTEQVDSTVKQVDSKTGYEKEEEWYSWVGSNHRPPVPQTGALNQLSYSCTTKCDLVRRAV
jgi:hypothetical protein